jgi:perosamine synthetase
MQAAMGCAQLTRLGELVQRRQEIVASYRMAFDEFPEIMVNPIQADCVSGSWMTNLFRNSVTESFREDILDVFSRNGIDGRVFFWPLSGLPLFGGESITSVANFVAKNSINLPTFHEIAQSEIELVVASVRTAIRHEY